MNLFYASIVWALPISLFSLVYRYSNDFNLNLEESKRSWQEKQEIGTDLF